MESYSSGYVTYCAHVGHTIGIIINRTNEIVTDYDCDYKECKHIKTCELCTELPIGQKANWKS